MELFLQCLLSGIMIGTVYALVALGFVLIYKASGVLNFAQGELLLLGAFVCWSTVSQLHLPSWAGFLIVFVYSIIFGILMERLILRHMIGQALIAIIMMTIGLSQVLKAIVIAIWGAPVVHFPEGFIPAEVWKVGPLSVPQQQVWSLIISAVLVVALVLFFQYTRRGLSMRAAAEDQVASQATGVKVGGVLTYTWIIAALVAAVGGILLGSMTEVSLNLGDIGLSVFPVVIGGGLESIAGAIVCGPLIGVLEKMGGVYLDMYTGGGTGPIIPYVFMLLFLIFRPYGLFGLKRIERI